MTKMRYPVLTISILAALCNTLKINKQCVIENNTDIVCRCNGNEDFTMPDNVEYGKITSVLVTSCVKADIDFSIFAGSKEIGDIVVQNISRYLKLRRFVRAERLRSLKLLRIRRMELISHDMFASLSNIVDLHIESAWIENFEEQFANTNVMFLTMINVTIGRMTGINFSERGKSLRIHDSSIKNVQTSLNFAFFTEIDISNSIFELKKPGHVSIEGNSAIVLNSVFTNISMNLVASNNITINASCADGKSSLRLSANRIESFDNRLPTEIVYTRNFNVSDNSNELPLIVNNTVCIAGNCKCPKSAGHNSYERFRANVYLGALLVVVVSGLF